MRFLPLMALLLASCTLTDPGQGTSPPDSLASARALWRTTRTSEYTIVFRWVCYCLDEYVAWVELEIDDDTVVSGRYVDSHEPLVDEELSRYHTVEGLFDFLEEAEESEAHRITVAFDAAMGYPTEAFVDYSENIADEERGFQIRELTRP